MRKLVKCLLVVCFVAVAGLVAAPACLAEGGDDVAAFYVPENLQVGSSVLDPGVYVVRLLHDYSNRNTLLVTNAEGTKVLAMALVTPHEIAKHEIREESRLLYDAPEGTRPPALRTFLVANSSFGYDIPRTSSAAKVAAAPSKELVALAVSR
jgi:hypothetical protein